MKQFMSFFVGLIVGGLLVFGSLKYHIVRASDGVHMVPKLSASFAETYVDIRSFRLSDWNDHRSLAVALVQAKKGYLMQEAASESLRRTVDVVIGALAKPAS